MNFIKIRWSVGTQQVRYINLASFKHTKVMRAVMISLENIKN